MQFSIFKDCSKLSYGLSDSSSGSTKLNDNPNSPNRAAYFHQKSIPLDWIVSASLTHGTNVKHVAAADGGTIISDVDALVTSDANIFLSITVADCFPVYLFDSKNRAVGLAHAGWRGVIGGIIESTIEEMREKFRTDPGELLVAIGPGIQVCHFEVKDDVWQQFLTYSESRINRDGHRYIDLSGVIRSQLQDIGVMKSNIDVSPECTFCLDQKYFSFRRNKPEIIATMVGYIGLRA
jgi:hypothetical protein